MPGLGEHWYWWEMMVCSRRGSVINTLRQKSQPASRCQCKLGIATRVMERSYYKPPWLHPCTLLLPAPGQNKCQLGTSHPHIGLHGTEWLLIPAPAALLKLLPPVPDCSPWKIDEVLSSSAGVRCKEPGSFLSPLASFLGYCVSTLARFSMETSPVPIPTHGLPL